jgi:WASH complex subunit strumpellin
MEAVYLFGVMLLMMETYLPGPVRERIVVAYYRRSGQTVDVDDIIKLTRATR